MQQKQVFCHLQASKYATNKHTTIQINKQWFLLAVLTYWTRTSRFAAAAIDAWIAWEALISFSTSETHGS